MMKKILWAVAAAATLATPAFAADIPRRQPIADTVYIPAAPAGVWTGFYVGAHLGGAFGSNFRNDVGYGLGGASGFLAGVQAGYDYQFNRVVLGVAGDLTYSTVSRRYIDLTPSDIRAKQDWSGSLRARLGYAVQDNMLLYVTGGLALGNVRLNDAVLGTSQSRMGVGWTLGAGARRLPAGRDGAHHVCARAGGLAFHDVLHGDGAFGARHAGLAPSAGRRLRQGRRAHRRLPSRFVASSPARSGAGRCGGPGGCGMRG
jgi:outer membrane immunogenic protein